MELDEKLSLMLRTSHKSRPERDLIDPVWSFYARTDTDCDEDNADTDSESELHGNEAPTSPPLSSPSSYHSAPIGSPMEPPKGGPSPQGTPSPQGGPSFQGTLSPQGGPSLQSTPSPQGSPPTPSHSGPPSVTAASRVSSSPTEPMEHEHQETKEESISSPKQQESKREQEQKHPKLRKLPHSECGVTEAWSTSEEDLSSEDNEEFTPKSRLPERPPSFKRRHRGSLINETASPNHLHLQNRRSLFSRTDVKNLVAGINKDYTFRGNKKDWSMIRRKHDLMHISCMSLKDKWRNLTKFNHVKQNSDGQWILQMD